MPWLDLSDHKGVSKPVKILPDCCVRDTKGPGKLGSVPYLAMIMSQHVPESAQSGRADIDSKLGQVPFQEGSDESLSPLKAFYVVRR